MATPNYEPRPAATGRSDIEEEGGVTNMSYLSEVGPSSELTDSTGDKQPTTVALNHAEGSPLASEGEEQEVNFNNYSLSTDELSGSEETSLIRVLPDETETVVPDRESYNTQPVYTCGFGKFRPKWLQIFARAKFFTFLLCAFSLTEGALVSGFRTVVVSTLERRYHFSSTASSIVLAAFDVAVILSVLFISYFGHKSHKPRILGIGLLLHGTGAFLYAVPQLLFGRYHVESDSGETISLEACAPNVTDQFTNDHCNPGNYGAYFFFLVGDFVMGIGAAPLFTIGISYIDDIVYPKYVAVHLGIFQSMAIVGPAIGYGLGGAFLSIYVDPWEDTSLVQSSPSWVGAWWLCFVVGGTAALVLAVPFLMFPRLLPDSHLVMEARREETVRSYTSEHGEERTFRSQLKTFPVHLKKLCQSSSWVLITLALTALFFSFDGMVNFGPKYLEAQFGLTSSTASLTLGALAVPTGAVGVLTGALLVYLAKSKGSRVAVINWVVGLIAIFPVMGTFLVTCPSAPIAGITTAYANASFSAADVTLSECNLDCHCTSSVYEPVCGADGLTYFSPCRAGCQKYLDNDTNDPIFENCSCIADSLWQGSSHGVIAPSIASLDELLLSNSTAANAQCPEECDKLPVFLVSVGLVLYLVLILKIPSVIITLRCVAEEQRTLALGAQSLIFRAFGAVPGPLLFGVLFDSACVYWEQSTQCGVKGHCWVYSRHGVASRALTMAIVGLVGNFVLSFLAWVLYPRKKKEQSSSSSSGRSKEEGGGGGREGRGGEEGVSGEEDGAAFELRPAVGGRELEVATGNGIADDECETEGLLNHDHQQEHTEL